MSKSEVCPYCGSKNYECMGETYEPQPYHCHECDRWFGDDDVECEDLRHKISAICSHLKATESNPINCEKPDAIELHIEGINEAAQGLSEAMKPRIMSIFQDYEAITWVRIEFMEEPVELSDIIIADSLREIYNWLEENSGTTED